MSYRIGSFNVRDLSFGSRDAELDDNVFCRRDYSTIGRIIMENFDIVALQEVKNEMVLSFLFPPYSGWKYCWQLSTSKRFNSDEGYAFAWNTTRIKLIKAELWVQYKRSDTLGNDGLLRQPYYGRFTPVDTLVGGPFCEIRLINTHIRYDPSKTSAVGKTFENRLSEFRILTEQIYNRVSDQVYGNNLPSYTFMLGDYNLNLPPNGYPQIPKSFVIIESPSREKKIITVQEKPTTISYRKETNPSTGEQKYVFNGYANNYDHFTYDEYYFNERGISLNTDTIDSVRIYSNNDFERHWRAISDHIPIVLELNLRSHNS